MLLRSPWTSWDAARHLLEPPGDAPEAQKTTRLETGGKPSTRLPPGKLVEHSGSPNPLFLEPRASKPSLQPQASSLKPPAASLQPSASSPQPPASSRQPPAFSLQPQPPAMSTQTPQKHRKRPDLTGKCFNQKVVIQASSKALRPPFWSSGLPLTSWDLLGRSSTPPGATRKRPRSTENDQT